MAKRKYACVSVDVKIQALDKFDNNFKSKSAIAKEFGVLPNTLSKWIKKTVFIRSSDRCANASSKRHRTAKHVDVESALVLLCRNARVHNIPLSGPIMQAKARDLGFACIT